MVNKHETDIVKSRVHEASMCTLLFKIHNACFKRTKVNDQNIFIYVEALQELVCVEPWFLSLHLNLKFDCKSGLVASSLFHLVFYVSLVYPMA